MIIEMLLDLLFNVFKLLTTPIAIPSLPEEVAEMFGGEGVGLYILTGFQILNTFFPMGYLGILLAIIVAIDIGISLYKFVMWILRKIPLASIN